MSSYLGSVSDPKITIAGIWWIHHGQTM